MRANIWRTPTLFIAILLLLPLILTNYGVKLTSEVLIMAIFVMSLGLIIGFAGLVSLGHAAFFGLGAYVVALLGTHLDNTYVLIIAAAVISGIVAFVSGLLFIRSSGAYFLMITLAFGQMLFAIFYKMESVTGGADGMAVSASLNLGFGAIESRVGFYYLVTIAFLVSYYLLRVFISSPLGKGVRGIKENESRMTALGYNIRHYKLIVYSLSGMLAGFAGALYAYFNQYVSPDLLHWMFSGQALIMVIVGGVGTLVGPAIGAGFFVILQSYISSYTDRWPMIMGVIFVAIVLYGRGGILQIAMLLWNKLRPKRHKEEETPILPKEGNGFESVKG
ncbi:branched-chain amino acid ABC transporter permease [Brevibacillus centrosporus]|uniref:Amino acid/amide ABC transporter membrane protein 2, HAAT family n=1 Tax=Brevibacillus centrosporus TaxID=54910 RepID=A0A1I3XDW2_9BACL|nr:branched-chain amino acid ABC transporter permease [Brevibacillus centrosporus]MEC2133186.1 branched-chain amino acid ABC transporter permease [Brevibacillus centrosporus]MED4910940.1 branched-chain amino acid ABC transporter permease [Brevibacillus centrosporus]RNB64930.1 branched-chain amino acid ABC transporter permease [Brevibacillus centrosporus]SFK17236.1 amino acid/amide ABC transporter membrane protein 2, HAAT family [Brevibacillus centrosporus]GED31209.1 branched-chain amino acid A